MWTDSKVDQYLFQGVCVGFCGSSDAQNSAGRLSTRRQLQVVSNTYPGEGNQTRRERGATFEGNTLQGKPRECQRHEIRPPGSLRRKTSRGWENLKAERIGWGKPEVSGLKLLCAVGERNLMRAVSLWDRAPLAVL